MQKYLKILLSLIFSIIILLGFALPLNPVGNWYQQFMPDLHGAVIRDITFTDSLTGYAVTNKDSFNVAYILKTTNAGENWFNSLTDNVGFTEVQFLNNNTGFVSRLFTPPGFSLIYKTINGGSNWFTINTAGIPLGMHVLNEDTIWMAGGEFNMGIFRTINGGTNWTWQYNSASINRIYMYNGRMGFAGDNVSLYRTTNSGLNWNPVSGGAFTNIYFIDSLTGWKSGSGGMRKTMDGGLNWLTQVLPSSPNITSGISGFSSLNRDTLWVAGGFVSYGGDKFSGLLFRTTNGGNNWLYQIPDTSFNITGFYNIQFLNKNTGWAFGQRRPPNTQLISYSNIHTANGGDTTFLVGLQQISTNIPKDFELKQNYPNPFNPRTVIPYKIRSAGYVTITAYDMLGRESQKLVSSRHTAGEYEVDFMGKFSASGVYFYRMEVIDDRSKQVYTETKKMLMIK